MDQHPPDPKYDPLLLRHVLESSDYYGTLGVFQDATAPQIKTAFNQLALRLHPDKNNGSKEAEEAFKKVYPLRPRTPLRPSRRAQYDLSLRLDRIKAAAGSQFHTTNTNSSTPSFYFMRHEEINEWARRRKHEAERKSHQEEGKEWEENLCRKRQELRNYREREERRARQKEDLARHREKMAAAARADADRATQNEEREWRKQHPEPNLQEQLENLERYQAEAAEREKATKGERRKRCPDAYCRPPYPPRPGPAATEKKYKTWRSNTLPTATNTHMPYMTTNFPHRTVPNTNPSSSSPPPDMNFPSAEDVREATARYRAHQSKEEMEWLEQRRLWEVLQRLRASTTSKPTEEERIKQEQEQARKERERREKEQRKWQELEERGEAGFNLGT